MYKSILLAVEGSENSIRAAKEAVKITSSVKDTEVTIIYVIDHTEAESEEIHGEASEEFVLTRQLKLQPIVKLLQKEEIYYQVELVYGIPSHVISEYANDRNFDVLIMGKRGINPMQEMILGSVSRGILNKANLPVLIVK